jgi:hypothetical protein
MRVQETWRLWRLINDKYKDGQLRVIEQDITGSSYRGQIEEMALIGSSLHIFFSWYVQELDFHNPKNYKNIRKLDNKKIVLNLATSTIRDTNNEKEIYLDGAGGFAIGIIFIAKDDEGYMPDPSTTNLTEGIRHQFRLVGLNQEEIENIDEDLIIELSNIIDHRYNDKVLNSYLKSFRTKLFGSLARQKKDVDYELYWNIDMACMKANLNLSVIKNYKGKIPGYIFEEKSIKNEGDFLRYILPAYIRLRIDRKI